MVDEIDQRILGVLTDSGREMTVSEVMDELMAIYGEPYRRCRIRNRLQTLVKFRYCTSREATESIRGKPTRFYWIGRRERMTCIHYKETLTALRGVRLSTRSCAMGILSSNLPEHCEHCPMRTEDAYVRCPICDRTFPSGVDMSYDGDWAMCKDCAKRLKGERMTDFNYAKCDFCGKEVRRNGHYRIIEGWLRIDCQSRGLDGEMCLNPCQVDACQDCVRKYPVLRAIYDKTRDDWTDLEKIVREASE